MKQAKALMSLFSQTHLKLAAAESCTAGLLMAERARLPGSGQVMDLGIVVYSRESKERCLGVDPGVIDEYGLTSEAVARAMALGVLKLTTAQVALANTGVAGPDAAPDGTTPGTVYFAWAFRLPEHTQVYSETVVFSGSRNRVRRGSVKYALLRAMAYHAMVFGPQSSFQPPPPRARVT